MADKGLKTPNEPKDLTVKDTINQELATKDTYLPAIPEPAVLEQLKQDNLEGIIPEFEVIKVPTGGQLAWAIPNETDKPTYEDEVAGVVLDHYPTRVYWEGSFEGGGALPDCSSLDGKTGKGNPGGSCFGCPMSQYDQDTGRVPCKEVRRVYLLTKESILPFLIPLPPTSGAARKSPWTSYVTKLFGRGRSVESVVTKLTLFEDKSKDGIKYSRVLPFMIRELTDEEKIKAQAHAKLFKDPMRQRPLTPEDEYNTNGTDNGGTVVDGSSSPSGKKEPWEK